MQVQKYSVLKRVKALKIPKNKPKYSFSVFDCMDNNPFAREKIKVPQVEKPLITGMRKFERRKKHAEALEKIKQLYPPELAHQYNSKKKRRKIKNNFASLFEYNIFCQYVISIGRGKIKSKKQRRRERGIKRSQRRTTYEQFIASPLWASRKNAYYQNHTKQCAACGSFKYIHLHHMVYGDFGKEPDEHLIPLCNTHHTLYHKKNGTQRHMIRTTMAFIEEIKSTK